jgi:uncharacterized protein DUF3443
VSMFSADNNGVLVQLPSVPDGGSLTSSGFLIFGIGTQSNNALGSSTTVYPVPDTGTDAGDFTTIFNGTNYSGSFIDSGSNGVFFLNTTTSGLPSCTVSGKDWYCPTSATSFTAANEGSNGQMGPTTHFTIENTDSLFNANNTAFSTLGGPSTTTGGSCASNPNCYFDWGLSFFYGRDVFTAIENESTPGGTGPYFAYNLP